jgi:hypothetical protein
MSAPPSLGPDRPNLSAVSVADRPDRPDRFTPLNPERLFNMGAPNEHPQGFNRDQMNQIDAPNALGVKKLCNLCTSVPHYTRVVL